MNSTTEFCKTSSSNSVSEEYWLLEDSFVVHGQVTAAFFLFYIVLGLPWNTLVVITVFKEKLYHQPTIMLLLNLVLIDILMLLYPLPVITVNGIAGEYIVGSTDWMRCQTCPWINLIVLTLTYDSLFTIALMSVDRFLFIYKPFQYERMATKLRTLVAIAVISILSIAIGSVSRISSGVVTFQPLYLSCIYLTNTIWYAFVLIIAGCAALTVIIVCNIWVIYIVHKNIKTVFRMKKSLTSKEQRKSHIQSLSDRVRKTRHKKQLHLFRVFGGLLISNIITWLPQVCVLLGYVIVKFTGIPLGISSLAYILFLSQAAVHPILETTLISDVREPLKEMVTCRLLKKKKYNLATNEIQTCSYCILCVQEQDESHSCCYLLTVIDAAVLPQEHSDEYTGSLHANNQNGQTAEVMESGQAEEVMESGQTEEVMENGPANGIPHEHAYE